MGTDPRERARAKPMGTDPESASRTAVSPAAGGAGGHCGAVLPSPGCAAVTL